MEGSAVKEASAGSEAVPPPLKLTRQLTGLADLSTMAAADDVAAGARDPNDATALLPAPCGAATAGGGGAGGTAGGDAGPSPGKIRKIGSPHTSRTAASTSSTATPQQQQPPQPPPASSSCGAVAAAAVALQDSQSHPQSHVDGGASPAASPRFRFAIGACTDPGPGPVNQDNYFVWETGDGQNAVVIVLDGHGRELGQMASAVAKRSLRGSLCHGEALARMRREPQRTMREAFDAAHEAVKGAFREHYERRGWRVREHEEGRSPGQRVIKEIPPPYRWLGSNVGRRDI